MSSSGCLSRPMRTTFRSAISLVRIVWLLQRPVMSTVSSMWKRRTSLIRSEAKAFVTSYVSSTGAPTISPSTSVAISLIFIVLEFIRAGSRKGRPEMWS